MKDFQSFRLRGFAFLFCLLALVVPSGLAQSAIAAPQGATPTDSLRVSLLTCAPGHAVHRLYGHTALRIENLSRPKEDWAYNFGWFSYDTPNFVVKFILGLTDYSMAKQSTAIFLSSHMRDDMLVTQQVLNISQTEAHALQAEMEQVLQKHGFDREEYVVQGFSGLDTLATLTPHWSYRYNFLYDNCTTRPIAALRRVLAQQGESIVFPQLRNTREMRTQRGMIHEFTKGSPWYEFGQDLMLGPEVDQPYSLLAMTEKNFLPVYAQNFFDQARICDSNGVLRPLVLRSEPLFPLVSQPQQASVPFTPLQVFLTLLGVGVLLSVGEYAARRKSDVARRAWRLWTLSFDSTLFALQGLGGCLIFMLVFFSEHPAVAPNWVLLLLNPLWLAYLPLNVWLVRKNKRNVFATLPLAAALGTLIVALLGVQSLPSAYLLLACLLLLRSGMQLLPSPAREIESIVPVDAASAPL